MLWLTDSTLIAMLLLIEAPFKHHILLTSTLTDCNNLILHHPSPLYKLESLYTLAWPCNPQKDYGIFEQLKQFRRGGIFSFCWNSTFIYSLTFLMTTLFMNMVV